MEFRCKFRLHSGLHSCALLLKSFRHNANWGAHIMWSRCWRTTPNSKRSCLFHSKPRRLRTNPKYGKCPALGSNLHARVINYRWVAEWIVRTRSNLRNCIVIRLNYELSVTPKITSSVIIKPVPDVVDLLDRHLQIDRKIFPVKRFSIKSRPLSTCRSIYLFFIYSITLKSNGCSIDVVRLHKK